MKKGIDVSYHNGIIDWNKVKKEIDFAIIRIGFSTTEDKRARRNIAECVRYGIPFGIYLYSYALDCEQAEKEAAFVDNFINKVGIKDKISLGIFFDFEDADNYKNKKGKAISTITAKHYTEVCATFTTELQSLGYRNVGIYSSDYIFTHILGKYFLQYGDILKWVARWSSYEPKYKSWDIWQKTSKGIINGINWYVDINYKK